MSNTNKLPLFREQAMANFSKDTLPRFLEVCLPSYYRLTVVLSILVISVALLLTVATTLSFSITYGKVEFEQAVQDVKLSNGYIKDIFVSESSSVEIGDRLLSMYRSKADYEDRELINADIVRNQRTLKLLEMETEQFITSIELLKSTYGLETRAVNNELSTVDLRLGSLNETLASIEKIVNRVKNGNSEAFSKIEYEDYIEKLRTIKISIINEKQKKKNLRLDSKILSKNFESAQLHIEQQQIQLRKSVIDLQRAIDNLKRQQLYIVRSEINGMVDFLDIKENQSVYDTVLAARIIPKQQNKIIILKLPTNLPFRLNIGDDVRIFSAESYINDIRVSQGTIRSISQSVRAETDKQQSYDVKLSLNKENKFHAGEKVGIIATLTTQATSLSDLGMK